MEDDEISLRFAQYLYLFAASHACPILNVVGHPGSFQNLHDAHRLPLVKTSFSDNRLGVFT